MNQRWKPWNKQVFTSMLAYDHLRETKRYTKCEAELCIANQDLHKRPGEEDNEIEIDMQQLVLRGVRWSCRPRR